MRLVEKEQAPQEVREVFQKIEANGARVINLYKAAANSPGTVLNVIRLGNSIIRRTELAARLREMVILRVARLSGCEYEWAHHAHLAKEAGLSQKQIEAIPDWKKSPAFSEQERAVLAYTDEVAKKVEVSARAFNKLKGFFDEQEIVELSLIIGYYGMLARLLVPLQVEVEDDTGSASDLTGSK